MNNLEWKNFDIDTIFDDEFCDHKIIIAKSPKFIDDDFNQSGILYGTVTRNYEGRVVFHTSYWDGVNDCYTSVTIDESMYDIKSYTLIEQYEVSELL